MKSILLLLLLPITFVSSVSSSVIHVTNMNTSIHVPLTSSQCLSVQVCIQSAPIHLFFYDQDHFLTRCTLQQSIYPTPTSHISCWNSDIVTATTPSSSTSNTSITNQVCTRDWNLNHARTRELGFCYPDIHYPIQITHHNSSLRPNTLIDYYLITKNCTPSSDPMDHHRHGIISDVAHSHAQPEPAPDPSDHCTPDSSNDSSTPHTVFLRLHLSALNSSMSNVPLLLDRVRDQLVSIHGFNLNSAAMQWTHYHLTQSMHHNISLDVTYKLILAQLPLACAHPPQTQSKGRLLKGCSLDQLRSLIETMVGLHNGTLTLDAGTILHPHLVQVTQMHFLTEFSPPTPSPSPGTGTGTGDGGSEEKWHRSLLIPILGISISVMVLLGLSGYAWWFYYSTPSTHAHCGNGVGVGVGYMPISMSDDECDGDGVTPWVSTSTTG